MLNYRCGRFYCFASLSLDSWPGFSLRARRGYRGISLAGEIGRLHFFVGVGRIMPVQEFTALISKLFEQIETPTVGPQIWGGMESAGFAINQVLGRIKPLNPGRWEEEETDGTDH